MRTTLQISETSPHLVDADAVVIGVAKGTGGATLVPGTKDVDEALGGALADTLAALGATGEAGEVTKVPTGGKLTAPLVVVAGMGATAEGGDPMFDPEALRRAAGEAVRALTGARKPGGPDSVRVALALPARDVAEVQAVALGALLGGYAFRRYRHETALDASLTLLTQASDAAGAAARAQVLADAVTLVRDLVNTPPSDLVPATLADVADQVAAEQRPGRSPFSTSTSSPRAATAGSSPWGRARCTRPGWSGWSMLQRARPSRWCWRGRGSRSTPAACPSSSAKSMEAMKSDMGGSGRGCSAPCRPSRNSAWPVRVVGYRPLAEERHAPAGPPSAPRMCDHHPRGDHRGGDEHRRRGRLVLADVLDAAAADSPDVLIDTATLTGAIGDQRSACGVGGVMAN